MIAASAVALAAAGCADDETSSAIVPVDVPGERGALVWAIDERPVSLDPLFASSPSEELVTRQIHEPLVAELAGPFDDARRVGGLAISALPSSDRTVWRLRLRSGVRFADGAPFNSQAVLANVERWQGSPTATALLGELLVDAPRPDLVRFILPRPDPSFDRRLASPRLGTVSPRAIAEAGTTEIEPETVTGSGTGPFELRERSFDRLLLAHNPGWWGSDRGLGPGLDQLEFTVVADAGERVALLAEGAAQVASRLSAAQLREVRANPLLTVIPEPGPTALGAERSVRGIPSSEPAPPLNGVWRTGIDAG